MGWKSAATLLSVAGLITSATAASKEPDWTTKHEAGRCAIRGQCGKQSFFGSELPCPDNGLAEDPADKVRDDLVKLCGQEWADTKVCCDGDQIDALKSNLAKANGLISGCGACKKNFYDLFCTFTCSPDQSLFVNVTKAEAKGDKFITTELDQLIGDGFGAGFYDSCKDVKLGATGGKAIDLIGGGAKNYTQFLKFLGDKKPFGSPFQIDFPRPGDGKFEGMKPVLEGPIPCNTTDEAYRCSCVDCAGSCPNLPEVTEAEQCTVGLLPCLSFAIVVVYSVFITLLVLAVTGHVAAAKRRQSKNERLQLLQDSAPSDDQDEGDMVHGVAMTDRPTKQYVVNTYCDRVFASLARTCARFPGITIGTSFIIVGLLSLGWLRFALETDPVKLWVAPDSAAASEKKFFDDNFGPFFRTEQAFLVNDTSDAGPAPVLSYNTLQWWFDVERRIRVQKSFGNGYTLKDVCYNPTGEACVVQSVSGYFASTGLDQEDWEEQLNSCAETPGDVQCLPEFKLPLPAERLLGGYNHTSQQATAAAALITTWVITNYNPGDERLEKAEEWEESTKRLLKDITNEAAERGLRLSFNTEISLEQELNKNTNTDAKIVVISYIVMFIYASLALGSTTVTVSTILRNPVGALVQSKFMLGIVGILIVLMSVVASVGIFAAAGVKATLIIAEVIPFLVLAVGVDNIFLIVHEFERVNISHADEPVSERIARALGRMGPSILLSASTETVAFALGAAVGMPAVRNFAAYAAGAVFINAVLQVTMFVSVLSLNQQRVEDGRLDCIPCVKIPQSHSMPGGFGGAPFSASDEEGWLSRFIRKYYAPAILGNKARVAILTIFLGFFAAGIALLPEVELGLDQRIAIPSDSYLIDYFNDLDRYFEQGAPVYFVVKDLNVTQRLHQQQLCARYTTCKEFSINNILEQERKRPEVSYIADATASWIDDFFSWLNPEMDQCCVDGYKACFEGRNPPWNNTLYGMPEGKEFTDYAKRWLKAPTGEDCPYGGSAAYGDAVVVDDKALTIPASHFRTAHTALHSQADFINAYASARRISNDISERHNIEVFPYSKFYIFFDQYATIAKTSVGLVGAALACTLVITSFLLGSILTGLVVTMTVIMIVVDIVGTMAVVGVSLNAVSLVNIVICVGIGVEFCAHIARAFTVPSASVLERAQSKFGGKDARAWAALVNVGGSVFSGITITKLLGVFVLAFTRSKIFEIYYFRVWLSLVVWAALHALVFLPVALTLFGGTGYIDPESDGGLEQDLASRRYRALLPDDEYDSDDY
ncbi:NPC intracellular sterol transporter 1-related protein 1 [Fulvia fulva]|uniref:NPC intracellular sterol transporter 1-related protein 1 n=1 Tax=Passalora fulva TaxID=5499 RepID=A0A9Q8L6W3_PASFU|nr:NPC intracellular sterol transporter 1-related protein 1 [Fulvia fulva]KAK4636528.1 NPC intracellular sterol transporter 1-related protein 1 [Fulvia fulva]UJO11991.1 NPC intracellular sterol transporter 1-related protein 1 [Fulvia fulva]